MLDTVAVTLAPHLPMMAPVGCLRPDQSISPSPNIPKAVGRTGDTAADDSSSRVRTSRFLPSHRLVSRRRPRADQRPLRGSARAWCSGCSPSGWPRRELAGGALTIRGRGLPASTISTEKWVNCSQCDPASQPVNKRTARIARIYRFFLCRHGGTADLATGLTRFNSDPASKIRKWRGAPATWVTASTSLRRSYFSKSGGRFCRHRAGWDSPLPVLSARQIAYDSTPYFLNHAVICLQASSAASLR